MEVMYYDYELEDGSVIKVGQQNFGNGTVPVFINGNVIDCEMFNEDGDIGFKINGEVVYFYWLQRK